MPQGQLDSVGIERKIRATNGPLDTWLDDGQVFLLAYSNTRHSDGDILAQLGRLLAVSGSPRNCRQE